MHLVQILLPLFDNNGEALGEDVFTVVRSELSERFGGLTAFTSAPAQGLWKSQGQTQHDEIVVFEVMAPHIDTNWWRGYRKDLERRFRQDTIIIRQHPVTLL